jgi:transcriptional regulator with XRE-family HTH domain
MKERDAYEREIIDNIRRYRQARGITQEELGRRCNMAPGYIGGIETYKRFPKVMNLKKIAEALEIDIAYLLSPRMAEHATEVHDFMEKMALQLKTFAHDVTRSSR